LGKRDDVGTPRVQKYIRELYIKKKETSQKKNKKTQVPKSKNRRKWKRWTAKVEPGKLWRCPVKPRDRGADLWKLKKHYSKRVAAN